MTRLDECILYRGFEHGEILDKMAALIQLYQAVSYTHLTLPTKLEV